LQAALDALGEGEIIWRQLGMMPIIANLIDTAVTDTAEQVARLTEGTGKPHVFDDALVDRIERLYSEQLAFIEIWRAQLQRWRTENPTATQRREIDRLETQISKLRALSAEAPRLAAEIRQGTIDRVMEKSDLELGLEFLAALARAPTRDEDC
jgi:hypothetical protein